MRFQKILVITLLVLFSAQVSAGERVLIGTPLKKNQRPEAEKQWYFPFEIGELKIKQSNDGSGIIKEVSCTGCDYQFVKINADTKVIVNGQKVNLLRARERAGKDAYIEFDTETAEVKYIYWTE